MFREGAHLELQREGGGSNNAHEREKREPHQNAPLGCCQNGSSTGMGLWLSSPETGDDLPDPALEPPEEGRRCSSSFFASAAALAAASASAAWRCRICSSSRSVRDLPLNIEAQMAERRLLLSYEPSGPETVALRWTLGGVTQFAPSALGFLGGRTHRCAPALRARLPPTCRLRRAPAARPAGDASRSSSA